MNTLTKQRPSGVAQLIPPFAEVTPTGLQMSADLAEEHWIEIGQALGRVTSASMWWIGDWWAFGEHRYGERKAIVEAEDWDGPAFQTCVNAANVCRKIESNRRRLELSFAAHAEVACLETESQEHLLNQAKAKKQNKMQVRDAVKRLKAETPQEWTDDELARKARVADGECVVANLRGDAALLAWAETEGCYQRIDGSGGVGCRGGHCSGTGL
jgi:hypothetical protein